MKGTWDQGQHGRVQATCELGMARKVIGIDIGACLGVATLVGHPCGQVERLSSTRHRLPGPRPPGARLVAFVELVESLLDAERPLCVAYEDVRRHTGTTAAHVYGALRGRLEELCYRRDQVLLPVGVGQAKRRLTGAGNATKGAMIEGAWVQFGRQVIDDNEADALAVALEGLDLSAKWKEDGCS